MGKACSRPRVQGFEIFEESACRTAPEGRPNEEHCDEIASTEENAQYCGSHQCEIGRKIACGKAFVSDCNLVVALPSESNENVAKLSCANTRPVTQTQATQTVTSDLVAKEGNRHELDSLSPPRGYNNVPVNDTDYRLTKKKRRRRVQQRSTETERRSSDPDLISAYIKERLALIALEGDRFLGKAEKYNDDNLAREQTNRKMRSRRRQSMLDKVDLTNDLPARDVTYPGACAPPDDANEINSLIVERGSECSTKLWLPCRNDRDYHEGFIKPQDLQHNSTHSENTTRCPCAHKHGSASRGTNPTANTQQDTIQSPPKRRTRRKSTKPSDGNRHDCCHGNNSAMTAHKIKIDRSCLCDRDGKSETLQSPGCYQREIVMRHEHHHYHHYPKSRSKTNRRHTFKI